MALGGNELEKLIKNLSDHNLDVAGKIAAKIVKEPDFKNDARAKEAQNLIEEFSAKLKKMIEKK